MRLRRVAAACVAALLAAQTAPPRVEVAEGEVEGVSLADGVDAYLGVPFAQPPVRELRWKPPQPLSRRTGLYHADRFAPECLQPLRGSRQNHYFGEEATSEDCLYLNIWAPRAARQAPVVVWIYGGGFNIGSANMANYSGEPLARDGVVRVNVAYRVGPLGFLAHPDLTKEGGYGGSGNYGLMDQIAALAWIRRNIANFGGDPANVTVVGQSAGSMSVALLQQSPLARGLFQRAVGMSGSPFGGMLSPVPLAAAEAQGVALAKELGASSLAELRAVPGDRLVAAQSPRSPIVLDGRVVTGTAEAVFARRAQADVPVLIGYTRDESFRPLPPVASRAELAQAVRASFGARAEAILAAYNSGDARRDAADIARDASVGGQMAGWAMHQQRYGRAPAYAYLFTRRQPYAAGVTFSDHDPATVGAYHTGDVPYWLRTRDALNLFRTTRAWEAGDLTLEREMSAALLSFARTGRPSSPSVGAWPAFKPDAPALVWLAPESRGMAWPHFADLALFAGVPPAPRTPARARD
ncbi:para-nitrobenzyl esterase [Sphingomonas guangdongensis]|uniref:Carboxylic ester hydrolase n=1 Tax=Sphingomonas guangdongensis TaxID=1141890 RepID=A0A285Q9F3_9SPHN|nr:carboxylesterase family protein [Sphingomonas guangdongensis]SOB78503.1 para-nitrobenzyl esterase [Sphingomonas guangdongensis]